MKKTIKITVWVLLGVLLLGLLLIAAGLLTGGSISRMQTQVTQLFGRIDYDYILHSLLG